MNNDRVILSADDIDLTKHGVIEAHAGTGKTYTIVNLVLRMLEEQIESRGKGGGRYVHLSNVLLVTYTEKAAGELKKRIREGIAAQINKYRDDDKKRDLAAHLEDCLNNMHEAFIGTIHSVCLRLLQTWPFETGVHFSTAMIEDDNEGANAALRTSMRTDWEDTDSGLPQGLKTMEENGLRLEKDKHIKLIIKTALKIMGDNDIILDDAPAGKQELEEIIDQINNAADAELENLQQKLLYAFINRAAKKLAARYDAYKRENGLVSYDDMLRLMRDAVCSRDGEMLKRLRERLRYGIIDEFQDTSPLQWNIFRKIFLEDRDGAKIYIVGDPKQSIYSFQGADINSYLSAKDAITAQNGSVYSLKNNFRSLPEMIDGYNAILCDDAESWFTPNGGDRDISYSKANAACPPPQRGAPPRPLPCKAVQVVTLTEKSVANNRKLMAETACAAIKKLIGTTISVPKGQNWEDLTLDYRDFAVITETNDFANPFIEAFMEHKIPYVKYKMKGVFESPIARDLIALLSAIHRRHSRTHRTKALLTHFFNRKADSIIPETDDKYCPDRYCSGDDLCVAHALDTWGTLADRQLWAQLFRSIIEKTGIRQRLIRLYDGERKLADLRQATDYCVSYLHSQNLSLERLITHLERLYAGEEEARDDKNLHTLATEKSSVKILTMHAAKGLEFPVVFLMNRDSTKSVKSPDTLLWTDADKKRHVTPCLSVEHLREGKGKNKINIESLERYQTSQEREHRRLLYVAMTRPQAMLFVPMRSGENKGKVDNDISPRLTELFERNANVMEEFNDAKWDKDTRQTSGINTNEAPPTPLDDIPALSLQKFVSVETCYSQISRELKEASHDDDLPALISDDDGGDVILTDERHVEDTDTSADKNQPLPGGRTTGDALHRAIDELMRSDDINAVINDSGALDNLVERHLRRGGILDLPSTADPAAAVKQASSYIKTALTLPYPIPNGAGSITISSLPKTDRVSEMEFLLSCDPSASGPPWDQIIKTNNLRNSAAAYRIRGFIDLLFRLKNEGCPNHPYRYYIVDWKSDRLESYGQESLRRYCADQNYLLQSQIYTGALDKYLSGILGVRYDREQHLGGSLYIFLRGGAGVFL
ncbi:MAG: UvrD-helicase domain-containing protein [Chitinispirillales bacterium]|jgi:exodeoxyribonuclease V beta subunit|nr:UvrD-helicase domain-containing protein [Chitinispirillales bacterium]